MAFRTSKSTKKSKPTPPSRQGNAKKVTEKKSQQIDSAAQKKKEKAKKIAKLEVITLAVMNRARLDDLGKDNQIQDLLDNLKTGFRAVGCNPNDFQKDKKYYFFIKLLVFFKNMRMPTIPLYQVSTNFKNIRIMKLLA